jgi:hypothetical protein
MRKLLSIGSAAAALTLGVASAQRPFRRTRLMRSENRGRAASNGSADLLLLRHKIGREFLLPPMAGEGGRRSRPDEGFEAGRDRNEGDGPRAATAFSIFLRDRGDCGLRIPGAAKTQTAFDQRPSRTQR